MNKMKIFEKFPSIKKLFTGPLKLVLRAVPLLGTLLTVGEGARILLSDSPKEDKIQVEVRKAQGQKCERCWKILEKKCERENCPIK